MINFTCNWQVVFQLHSKARHKRTFSLFREINRQDYKLLITDFTHSLVISYITVYNSVGLPSPYSPSPRHSILLIVISDIAMSNGKANINFYWDNSHTNVFFYFINKSIGMLSSESSERSTLLNYVEYYINFNQNVK